MGKGRIEITARTETILYTVIKYCDHKIAGLPDTLAGRDISEFPAVENAALEDLMQNRCATMDFNGRIELDQEYLECIQKCTKCREVAGVDIRRPDGRQDHMTVYYMGKNRDSMLLKNIDGKFAGVCGIYQVTLDELIEQISDLVNIGTCHDAPEEYRLESSIVQTGALDKIRECGCGRCASELIAGISKHSNTALIARKFHGSDEKAFFSAVWGCGSSMEMEVEYSDFKEYLLFRPLSKDAIIENIRKTIEA